VIGCKKTNRDFLQNSREYPAKRSESLAFEPQEALKLRRRRLHHQ
jgi:hypothetical protein